MSDTRRKDKDWIVTNKSDGLELSTWDQVQIAVLMDIRDELKSLSRLLHCPNFTGIPHTLNVIRKNTTKPRRRAKK